MAVVFALISAGFYGVADFLGGFAAKTTHVAVVLALSQAVGLIWLLFFASLYSPPSLSWQDAAYGVAAGTSMATGMAAFYFSLAAGRMSVVAPVAGLFAIIVPVVTGAFLGEDLSAAQLLGIGLALASIVLVTRSSTAADTRQSSATGLSVPPRFVIEVVCAPCAGIGIGLFYVFLKQTDGSSGLWPLIASRGAGSIFGLIVWMAVRTIGKSVPFRLRPGVHVSSACGTSDAFATAFFLLAARQGLLSIVGTLASLYPVVTVALARLVLRERLRPIQILGVTLAAIAIVLISNR